MDYHGHSWKKNSFVYGCNFKGTDFENWWKNALISVYPLLLAKINPIFAFKDCWFNVEKCKESTARVVCFWELGILNSFTLETSFYGPDSPESLQRKSDSDIHMDTIDFQIIGWDSIRALHGFFSTREQDFNVILK